MLITKERLLSEFESHQNGFVLPLAVRGCHHFSLARKTNHLSEPKLTVILSIRICGCILILYYIMNHQLRFTLRRNSCLEASEVNQKYLSLVIFMFIVDIREIQSQRESVPAT